MISTQLVTTLDIPSTKIKTFIFNRTVDDPEKEAKKFCIENKMKFLRCEIAEPYTLNTWQHYKTQIFIVECTSRTPLFFYEYGKL